MKLFLNNEKKPQMDGLVQNQSFGGLNPTQIRSRGGREQEEVEAEENAVRIPDEQLECDKKDDPLIFGEEMIGEKLGHT